MFLSSLDHGIISANFVATPYNNVPYVDENFVQYQE